jgi:parallel beta-helix repeat protein
MKANKAKAKNKLIIIALLIVILIYFLSFIIADTLKENSMIRSIENSPTIPVYTGDYHIERQDGNESLYTYTFEKQPDGKTKITQIADFESKTSEVTYKDGSKSLSLNYKVPDTIKMTKGELFTETIILEKDIVDKEGIAKMDGKFKDGDKQIFVYYADPKTDFYLKFGESSTVIVQNTLYDTLGIQTNVTSEPNNITHLEIDNTQEPYDSLVGYWNFDKDTSNSTGGIKAHDWSSYNNDGTYGKGAFFDTTGCISEGCVQLDGINDYVVVANSQSVNLSTGIATISFWAYGLNNPSTKAFLAKRQGAGGYGYLMYISAGAMTIDWGDGVADRWATGYNFPSNVWTHIVYTYNGTGGTLYINGTANKFTNKGNSSGVGSAVNLAIGSSSSLVEFFFNGSIDEVMIFNSSLNSSQIYQVYNNQSSRFKPQGTQDNLPVNITNGFNRVNVSFGDIKNANGNISMRLGYWGLSSDYNLSDINSGENKLVTYLNFDNLSDLGENYTFVRDRKGLNNATVYGASQDDYGIYSGRYNFDGTNDYMKMINNIGCNNDNFSVSLWANAYSLDSSYDGIITTDQAGDTAWKIFRDSNNQFFSVRYNSSALAFPNTQINTWHHYSFKKTGTNVTLYYDGVMRGSIATTLSCNSQSGEMWLGTYRASTANYFNGSIDELLIFNRSITDDEVRELYVKGRNNWNYTSYQSINQINTNYTYNIATSTTNILQSFKLTAGNYNFYSPILADNAIIDQWNVTEEAPAQDNEYSKFSNYWDNNASLSGNGIGLFNVSIDSTNGTVFLQINGTNYTAVNLTSNIYNVSVNLSNGTYPYYWGSWGNGTSANYNISNIRYYTVNVTEEVLGCGILSTQDSSYILTNDLTSAGTCFNITASNVTLDCNGYNINYSSSGIAGQVGIGVSDVQNVTIKNCKVNDGNFSSTNANRNGILFYGTDNSFILNSTVIVNSSSRGIYLGWGASYNVIQNSTGISGNNNGIFIEGASNNNLTNSVGSSTSAIGIYVYASDNCTLMYNNGNSSSNARGLYLYSSNYNTISYNNFTSISGQGVRFERNSSYNILNSNIVSSNTNKGIAITMGSSYNNLTNNIAYGGTRPALNVEIYSENNTLINNTGMSNSSYGISVETESNNNVLLNNFGKSNYSYGTFVNLSDGNQLTNHRTEGYFADSYALFLRGANNTIIRDCINVSAINGDVLYNLTQSINNTFINCTYRNSGSNETIMAGSELIRKWYVDINVTNSSGNALANSNVTGYNVTGSWIFSNLSESNGRISRLELKEYTNNAGTRVFETPHIINVSLTDYTTNSSILNLSLSNNVITVIILYSSGDSTPPSFTSIPANISVAYGSSFSVNFVATDNVNVSGFFINWTNLFDINSSGTLINNESLLIGNYLINVSAKDTSNNTNSLTYSVNVYFNDPPIVNNGAGRTGGYLQNQTINITSNITQNNISNYTKETSITDTIKESSKNVVNSFSQIIRNSNTFIRLYGLVVIAAILILVAMRRSKEDNKGERRILGFLRRNNAKKNEIGP